MRASAPTGLPCEVDVGMDQELLGQLDDGAIRATHVLARSALGSQARDDLDDEVDLVRQKRIQVDERLGGEFGQLDVGRETRVVSQAAPVLREELA